MEEGDEGKSTLEQLALTSKYTTTYSSHEGKVQFSFELLQFALLRQSFQNSSILQAEIAACIFFFHADSDAKTSS